MLVGKYYAYESFATEIFSRNILSCIVLNKKDIGMIISMF